MGYVCVMGWMGIRVKLGYFILKMILEIVVKRLQKIWMKKMEKSEWN